MRQGGGRGKGKYSLAPINHPSASRLQNPGLQQLGASKGLNYAYDDPRDMSQGGAAAAIYPPRSQSTLEPGYGRPPLGVAPMGL